VSSSASRTIAASPVVRRAATSSRASSAIVRCPNQAEMATAAATTIDVVSMSFTDSGMLARDADTA